MHKLYDLSDKIIICADSSLFLGQTPFFTCDKCNVNKQNLLFLLISIRFIEFCSWPQCRRRPRLNIDQFPKRVHAKGASF